MTQYTIRTSIEEADQIINGDKSFIFRGDQFKYGYGDRITFQVYKAGKMTRHPITKNKYQVTYVTAEAPMENGWRAIGFRRIA